jgi:glycosyltransferase involved in cell wall biosynthesis
VTETQGLVTLEAMAAGLPVVAVDGSGTRDIVENGVQGFLVENDPKDLARGILKILRSPSLMGELRAAALKKSRSYDNKRLARKMLKVYEQAIEDKKEGLFVKVEERSESENTQKVAA